jgi:UPF0176 protein
MNQLVVAALYQFVELPDYQALRAPLLDTCMSHDVQGNAIARRRGN